TKYIKRGHAWVYADALKSVPRVSPGTPAILMDHQGRREVARGYLDPVSPIAFRACSTTRQNLNRRWAEDTMSAALEIRKLLFAPFNQTSGFRLFNGEGDGLPGLVCDVYNQTAMLTTDGSGAEGFWQVGQIARWLSSQLEIEAVFFKTRDQDQVQQIFGPQADPTVYFLENGITFTANMLTGHKTGFYLDQRENRALIQKISSGKTVLNAFGYTGGFSVYAGRGNAAHVTTLDIAVPALEVAERHWAYNQLPPEKHQTVCLDAFDFFADAAKADKTWEVVILDPPSFAPSEASLPQAEKAYTRLISLGAQVTAKGGLLAAASCSSHIRRSHFLEICIEGISEARRKAVTMGIHGQPADHPAPLVMPELRYLKFVMLRLD
ncbi:MAG: class I SAM-dependent rRNA methyltransferase, partial [Anaerolineales bacterium]